MISRRRASIKNAYFAMCAQIVKLLGQFVVQTIFVHTLGAEYLGANGLFNNLLTFLSFAELGIGFAFSYALYKPLADENQRTISAIINLYRKVYNAIGYTILFAGILIAWFVPFLVNSNSQIHDIRVYFILFLLSSVVSYFFTYNRSLLIADQKGFIDSRNQLVFSLVKSVGQILFLIFFNSYAGFLITQIVTNICSNISITHLTHKQYPYLQRYKNASPDKAIVKQIKKNVVGTISSKIGSIVVNGTDNILISKFVGLATVGFYSNYSLIISGIVTVLNQVLNSVIASFGNLGVSEADNKQKQVNLFNEFVYFNAISTFFIGLLLTGIFQPFIGIWLGSNYKLSETTVLLIVVNFVFSQFRPALFLVNAYGLFWGYRYKSVVEACVNFAISFYLVKYTALGINGVLIGTIIGNIFVNSWWDPLILFSGAYQRSIFRFYIKYWSYLVLFFSLVKMQFFIINLLHFKVISVFSFVEYAVILSIFSGSMLLICLSQTRGERDLLNRLRQIIK